MDGHFGVFYRKISFEKKQELLPEIERLLKERNKSRQSKDYSRADEIRTELYEKFAIEIRDTQTGSFAVFDELKFWVVFQLHKKYVPDLSTVNFGQKK